MPAFAAWWRCQEPASTCPAIASRDWIDSHPGSLAVWHDTSSARRQREYNVFSAADIDWTALRPPLVTDGAPLGYRLDLRLRPGGRVRRADVASALVDQLIDSRFHHAAPFLLPPT
jgi:hypothetical protein